MTAFNKPDREQAVFICFPHEAVKLGWQRGYIGGGACPDGSEMGLKTIVAIPKDQVVINVNGISVNGRLVPNSRALPHDSANRPMDAVNPGIYTVRDHEVWIVGVHDQLSYDSRYFGSILWDNIQGNAYPIFVSQ